MKARKIPVLFTVLMLCFYSLISSILGERGIIVNNQLRRQLKSNEYKLDRDDVEIETLRIARQDLATKDSTRSGGISLGYKTIDDEVYVFASEDATPPGDTILPEAPQGIAAETGDEGGFTPWGNPFILLISFCSSFIITLLAWLLRKDKGRGDDSQQAESGNFGNNFNID